MQKSFFVGVLFITFTAVAQQPKLIDLDIAKPDLGGDIPVWLIRSD